MRLEEDKKNKLYNFPVFTKNIIPLFRAFVELNFTEAPFFEKLISDDLMKKSLNRQKNFYESAAIVSKERAGILSSILRGNLDVKKPEFK